MSPLANHNKYKANSNMYKQNMVVADIEAPMTIAPGETKSLKVSLSHELSLDGTEMVVPYGSVQILGSPVLLLLDKWTARLDIFNPHKPIDVKSLINFSVDEKVLRIAPGDKIGYVVKINPFITPPKESSGT